jgi:hypothetical protein
MKKTAARRRPDINEQAHSGRVNIGPTMIPVVGEARAAGLIAGVERMTRLSSGGE